ncbi:hypothetical protein U1Q18_004964 [Sarracenia purpurea var. burkii]
MLGTISNEIQVKVPASQAWELYSTLQLAKLLQEDLPHLFSKVEVIEGTPGFSSYKEKFTKIDDEKRVKETEVIEGGFLDLGFNWFRVRFEIIEKSEESCITKATIEYDLKEEAAANASIVTIQQFVSVMEAAANYLITNNNSKKQIN